MKKILISCMSLTTMLAFGQQYSLNTQYMFNEAFYNPAAAGSKEYIPINFNFRSQWAGFDGAPVSQSLTAHSDMGKNLGFGGYLFNEVTGPSRSTGANLMLSYRLKLSKNNLHNLRFGLGVSVSQHLIDVNKLTTEIPVDPAIANAYNNQFVPDADAGVYYTFSNKGFAGFSLKNVTQMRRNLFSYDDVLVNTMKRHYYFMGGYDFDLSDKWILKTSTMLRFIESRPFQFDVNAIVQYNKFVWLGVGYRHLDAISALLGFQFGSVKLGYSYDYTLSDIRKASSGSHEIFLELQVFKKATNAANGNTPWLKRNRIYTQPIF